MSTKTTEGLQEQIERLVREHLAAQQKAVTAAVARAFSMAVAAPSKRRPTRAAPGRRRKATELESLAERLCQAVRVCPGETMTTIAKHVGEAPPVLRRPMLYLKRTGRVRSAGERSHTRYFPMAAAKSQ